jgi:hypothetical protein
MLPFLGSGRLAAALVYLVAVGCLLAAAGDADPEPPGSKLKVLSQPEDRPGTPNVIYVPTPQPVVDKMLELAKLKKRDIVFDLGCGDGRIVVTAAKKYGCRAVGFEIDPLRVKDTRLNIQKNKVEKLAHVRLRDVFKLDLSEATVVTLYLLPSLNVKLIPQLKKLKKGSRIISHAFDMKGVIPDKGYPITVKDQDGVSRHVYLWTTPLKLEKE